MMPFALPQFLLLVLFDMYFNRFTAGLLYQVVSVLMRGFLKSCPSNENPLTITLRGDQRGLLRVLEKLSPTP